MYLWFLYAKNTSLFQDFFETGAHTGNGRSQGVDGGTPELDRTLLHAL